MNIKTLTNIFDCIASQIDNYEEEYSLCLNAGGCGFVALCLYDILSKYFPCKIRMFDYEHIRVQHNGRNFRSITSVVNNCDINSIRDLWDMDMNLVHVVVEIDIKGKKYMADSTGIYAASMMKLKWAQYTLVKGHIPRAKMKKLWDNERGWNDSFDRENCGIVEDIIVSELEVLNFKRVA